MAIDLRQSLRLTQAVVMTPQLQQAIKLLQLSRIELEEFVTSQIEENPVLEEVSASEDSDRLKIEELKNKEHTEDQAISEHFDSAEKLFDKKPGEEKEISSQEDFDQMSSMQDSKSFESKAQQQKNNSEESPNYENFIARKESLQEHLLKQVGEYAFSDDEKQIAEQLIGNIDDKGYLQLSNEELFQNIKFDKELIEGVLDTIQNFDPLGVGARDLKECLLIQLKQHPKKNKIVKEIIEHHLNLLEVRNFPAIAKVCKLSLDQVYEHVQIIADLEPIPGRQFGGENPQYVVPDVYVFTVGGQWKVSLNEDGLPRLQVSHFYSNMLGEKSTSSGDKNYLQDKLKSANWLIKSIEQRQKTILKVTESIVLKQKDFFDKGPQFLKPMVLKDIAEDLSLHESTISRVTSNKYMHSPRGIFELKYFFNTSVATDSGDNVASESVKKMIEDLVKVEDPKKPLSDQKIAELLNKKGIHLARRTVAKYREQLNILPSSHRKKMF